MIRFLSAFLFVCLCGLIVGSAGGVTWGTESCGILAAVTVWFGVVAGFMAACWEGI